MKRPMRRYRPDPIHCAECGGEVRYVAERWAWVHVERGADHAPRIAGLVPR